MRCPDMRWLSVPLLLSVLSACGAPTQTAGSSNLRIADAALSSGSPQVALQVLDNTLKSDPRNLEALLRQGKANVQTGNTAAAEASFRRAIAVDAGNTEAHTGLGKVLLASNVAEAETHFALVAERESGNTAVLNNLGVARDIQGKHAEAQEAYRKALTVNPGLASAQQNLALSLAISGRPQEGAVMLNQLANAGTGGRKVRDNLAVALALAGETAQAGQVLREELTPADAATALDGYRALKPRAVP